jgi:hypothetical protein
MKNKTPLTLSERLADLLKLVPEITFEQVISWVFEAE